MMAGDDRRNDDDEGARVKVVIKSKPKTKKPSMYKVLLLNGDYTPMEFVVHVLEALLREEPRGSHADHAACAPQRGGDLRRLYLRSGGDEGDPDGIDFARRHQHPLQCTMEKE